MPVTTRPLSRTTPAAYPALLKLVRQTLLEGQQRIEQAKVETYWQTGKYISEFLLKDKTRSEHYGENVIERLAKDLEVQERLLQRTLKFYKSFPDIPAVRPESFRARLSWSHYRELITVPDEKTRLSLLNRAAKEEWTHYKLIEKIKLEARSNGHAAIPAKAGTQTLHPKLGELYTYRLLPPENVQGVEEGLWLDLGFDNHHFVTRGLKGLQAGQIVESVKAEDGSYSVRASKRGEEALFTYKAVIERVVDGDTLIVKIDQGFNYRTRHYLRLRGVDCAELATAEGKRAKAFVEKTLKGLEYVLMSSTRSDKYGRYLADLHIPLKDGKPEFLNQRLLDEGLAEKV